MKYLKRFFESYEMFDPNDLNDCLADLNEIGYKCRVSYNWWNDRSGDIAIVIYGKDYKIYLEDIYDIISRATSLLSVEDYFPDERTKSVLDDFDIIIKNPKSPDSLDILGSPDSIFKSKKTGPIELVPSNFSFYFNQQD